MTPLQKRLSIIEGQVGGLKRYIGEEQSECAETVRQLKTIIRSLKTFGEAYLHEHLDSCMTSGKKSPEEMKDTMETIISSLTKL
jgi:DNA-binding FrmR family transcriptional regulator